VPLVPLDDVGDDAALVEALRDGARWAPAVLYDRYAAAVERLIVRLLGDGPDVDDVFQEVFIAAFRGIRDLRDPQRLRSWLLRIAVLTARDCLRARQRGRRLVFLEPDHLPEVEAPPRDDCKEAVRRAYQLLDRMAPTDRIPFVLHLFTNLELSEIADSCGTSLATVKRRIARGERWFNQQAQRDLVLRPWLRQESAP
jgi:RNA polymerase sigma-70 factor, ECF subfamily